MKIHAVQTGWVKVKAAHRLLIGPEGLRYLAILGDPRWTEWLPIYTWVIEHPEGVIVIDTGESSQINDPAFFTGSDATTRFVLQNLLRFRLTPDDEIGPQLRALGISPQDVRWVIMTHLHSDHSDGMRHFPSAEFLIAGEDYQRFRQQPVGAVSTQWPEKLAPTFVDFVPGRFSVFPQYYPVTKAGDVVIVPTPGHTLQHQSVVLKEGDLSYFFAGDTTFSDEQLLTRKIAGIVESVPLTRQTLSTINAYVQNNPTIYLPSHDHASAKRLEERSITTDAQSRSSLSVR